MSSVVAAGAILAGLGLAGRYLARQVSLSGVRHYKGGFDSTMSKLEASRILGISPSSNADKIKQAHKRIMLINHPDRGGSPYIAAKINEAKDILERQ